MPVRCPVCKEAFNSIIEVTESQWQQALKLDVDCHYCNSALRLDLEPYKTPLTLHKSQPDIEQWTLQLPQELRAQRRPRKSS